MVKNNNDGCFQLKQRIHLSLFESFKLVFDTSSSGRQKVAGACNKFSSNEITRKFITGKIDIEKKMYNQFSVSSKTDIQTVINFFSFSGLHSLIGLKSISYTK